MEKEIQAYIQIREDINHYQRVVVALKETIRLMAEVDMTIPGWPME